MFSTAIICFTVFFLTGLNLSVTQNIDELAIFESKIKEFMHSGYASDEFLELLKFYRLPHVFREGMEKVYDNPTTCALCNFVVNAVIVERDVGLSRDDLINEAMLLCTNLDIEPERVCRGVIEFNVDVFLYVIDNYPDFTSERFCGSVLQSFDCPTGGGFDWTINVSEGNSPERPTPNDTQTEGFKILQLSDIHYDPLYTPYGNAACGEPICCQDDQGEPPSTEDTCGYWSDYRNSDTPWHLVTETISQTKKQDFDYVYYTGDIISHRVWETSVEKNTADITKLLSYFKEQYDVPVFPIFGNHEPHPLNLWPIETVSDSFSIKWLFELAAEQWSQLIGEDVSETVLKGGYYSVSPRPGFRVIGINSNLGYTDNFWLIYNDVDPFNQLQWLADTLQEAETNNESVHILGHVPTGSSSCLKVWNREYVKILERFANTITGQFNGHTHKDEWLVYYNSSSSTQAIAVAFNGASVTPMSDNNPSFKYYTVDETTFHLLDYEEWYFNLTLANSMEETDPVEWLKLYSFVETFGVNNLLPSEVDKVLYKMTEDHALLDDYFRFKVRNGDTGIANGCNENCKRNLLCDIVTTLYGNNEPCNRFLTLYDQ